MLFEKTSHMHQGTVVGKPLYAKPAAGARFSKVRKGFHIWKAVAKSLTFWLQSCFIHTFLIWTEVRYILDVSGVYTSPFLDAD